jgi:hypothetical protein
MTVRAMLATLQRLPRDAELLAFEAGCEDYCERSSTRSSGRAAGYISISVPAETTRTAPPSPGRGLSQAAP